MHPRHPETEETTCEERRRDLEPDPGQADRRGALRGAQAEPRRGVQEDRPADQRARLPQGQGPADGHRPAGRPRRGPRRGDQRGAPADVHRGAAEQRPRAAGAAGDRGHRSSRTTRPSSSPPRSTSSPRSRSRRTTASRPRSTTSRSPTRTSRSRSQALRERFATLNDVERAAADGDFVVIDLKATQDGEVVEGAEVSGMSYQVGRGGMLDGLDEALDRHEPPATRRPSPPSWSAATWSAQDVEVAVDGHRRSRSRSSPSSTTTSPRWRRSSTPSTS